MIKGMEPPGDNSMEITMSECTRKNTCYDCDNKSCLHQGDKGADCPKYKCDNPNGVQNCENCEFIDDFIKEMRDEYEKFRKQEIS